jgi:uncharacterized protein
MDALKIIEKYYDTQSEMYRIIVKHSRNVADKALAIAKSHPEMNFDLDFIEEAAMLHDIGVVYCDANEIGCHGSYPYICHGYLGAELLRKEGLPRHALVCERHTGTGITSTMIKEKNLPLPDRDMIPISMEEQLICFADKFFSKSKPDTERDILQIQSSLRKHGEDVVERFYDWQKLFL